MKSEEKKKKKTQKKTKKKGKKVNVQKAGLVNPLGSIFRLSMPFIRKALPMDKQKSLDSLDSSAHPPGQTGQAARRASNNI